MALPNYSAAPVQMRKYSLSFHPFSFFYFVLVVGGGIFNVFKVDHPTSL